MLFDGLWRGMRLDDGPVRKKKGIGRFFEIIGDNLGRFLMCNFFCVVSMIPAVAGIAWGLSTNNFLAVLCAGILGGVIFGPTYGAMTDGMLYAIRDVPGSWWRKYRHAWKRDWKDCLLPGGVLGAMLSLLLSEVVIVTLGGSLPVSIYVCTGVALAVFAAVSTYFWPQRVFADLTLVQTVRNSLLMCMAHPATALKAVAVQALYWGLFAVLLPHSALLLPILGLWLPELWALLIIYPRLNEDFRIEERLGWSEEPDEDGAEDEDEDLV